MKRNTILFILVSLAAINVIIWVVLFILDYQTFDKYPVNSKEWYDHFYKMINYMPRIICSFVPLLIASIVNACRKEEPTAITVDVTYQGKTFQYVKELK